MWKRFFGPNAKIVGVDIRSECQGFEEDQIAVRIGNQSDGEFLASLIGEFGQPDIVLDDGSHQMSDIAASFDFLYPRLSPRGTYVVEDLHTSYWPEFGGGLKSAGSFVEVTKSLIDELNSFHSRDQLPVSEFARSTDSLHFYDSIVVLEKIPRQIGRNLRTGG